MHRQAKSNDGVSARVSLLTLASPIKTRTEQIGLPVNESRHIGVGQPGRARQLSRRQAGQALQAQQALSERLLGLHAEYGIRFDWLPDALFFTGFYKLR